MSVSDSACGSSTTCVPTSAIRLPRGSCQQDVQTLAAARAPCVCSTLLEIKIIHLWSSSERSVRWRSDCVKKSDQPLKLVGLDLPRDKPDFATRHSIDPVRERQLATT